MTFVWLLCLTSLCMTLHLGTSSAIKIQTYNAGLLSQIDNYDDRKPNIIRALQSADYDVMCLQEVWFGDDVGMLKRELDRSVYIYTPPLYQEKMFWGTINAPPCHNAPLTVACSVFNCADLVNNIPAFVNCSVDCGLMSESQECISCLAFTGLDMMLRCFNYYRRESINAPGVVLLSKRKVTSAKTVFFEPNVKQIIKRAYIEAEIEDVGTVFCSHSTSNANTKYYEPNLRDVYKSWREQNLADSRKLTEAASMFDKPLIIGDLNTSPDVPAYNVTADLEDSYNHFLSEGFVSPYVTMVGKCTFCLQNPLVIDWNYNNVLDHVMVRNHTVLSAKRFYDQNTPGQDIPMSDHYGVEVEIEN
ncbi:uncharacterized protein LOC132563178 [Ylistrum balloti]|uniref:uncharacterized protein LOC132563178 n=1 Tax=Ylistrum balloti TaxID=509963 RepID=UPI002905AD09|nr:uncharacterized protein LOC132563178 [Ylistrum balloti]